MTTTASKNGSGTTPRKQLSDQLDRLDSVIDALDEGLKGAVADAVREAVQAVLVQVMTNPDLQRMMRQAAAPAEQPRKEEEKPKESRSLLSRLWGKACSAANACVSGVGTAVQFAGLAWGLAGGKTKTLVLAGAATAAGAAYAARDKIALAARGVAEFVSRNAGRLLGRPAAVAHY